MRGSGTLVKGMAIYACVQATPRMRTAPRSSTGSNAMAKTRARSWSVPSEKGSLLNLTDTARTTEAMLPATPCSSAMIDDGYLMIDDDDDADGDDDDDDGDGDD